MKDTTKANRKNSKRNLGLSISLAALAVATSGCYNFLIEDLDVAWSVDGKAEAGLCATTGVDHFVVEADGTEQLRMTFDCGTWSTGPYLHGLFEGHYNISVEARDAWGNPLARLERPVGLYESAAASHRSLTFDFDSSTFGATPAPASDPGDEAGDDLADEASEDDSASAETDGESNAATEGEPEVGHLEVSWTVSGMLKGSTDVCGDLDLGRWKLTLEGPESREVDNKCSNDDPWNTGDELHNLTPGTYELTFSTFDATGALKAPPIVRTVTIEAGAPTVELAFDL